MSRTLKLVLAYDGTGLVGWQRQPAGVSVQALLERALGTIEGRPVPVVGAGRTDAGVHAIGQVASCRVDHAIGPEALGRALNAMLPADIRVLRVDEVPDEFHARHSARGKTYRYLVAPGRVVSPFEHRFVWHVPHRLDVASMASAARLLEGTRDFASFEGSGSAVGSTVRTVTRSVVRDVPSAEVFGPGLRPASGDDARLVVFDVSGDGFLRHMVRNAIGSLAEIGAGRRDVAWINAVLASLDRTRAGPTAPAAGLFLVSVEY